MLQQGLPQNGMQRGLAIQDTILPMNFKHTEMASINSILGERDQYLGLMKLWNQNSRINTPIMKMTELSNNIMYTDSLGQAMQYMVPYKVSLPYSIEDISGTNDKVGLNKEPFFIVLNTNRYNPGDRLKYDRRSDIEVVVDLASEVKPYGSGYLYQLRLLSDDRSKYVSRKFLQAGVEWFKVGNVKSEFSTQNSSITSDSDGVTMFRYETGQAIQSVEHCFTGHSDMIEIKSLGGNIDKTKLQGACNPRDIALLYAFDTLGDPNDPANPDRYDPSKMVEKTGKWMPRILQMLYQEQAKMQEMSLMWSTGGTVFDAKGTATRVGMGLYPQLKSGRYIQYSDTSQLLLILKNVMGELFYNRTDLPTHLRYVKFEMGMGALQDIQKSFQQDFKMDNPFSAMLDHPSLKGVLTGDNMNLSYGGYRFTSYTFPECGRVDIEHNPALDFEGTKSETSRYGRFSNSSYSVLVKDLTSSSLSNANLETTKYSVAEGFNNGANIVMIKPKNYAETYTSFRVGVYCPEILAKYVGVGNNTHIASMDEHGFKVVIHWTGEVWLKDPSRTVLIERLDPLEY